jgi:hypothetical protein
MWRFQSFQYFRSWMMILLPSLYRLNTYVLKRFSVELRSMSENDGKNVPEQETITVDNQGDEQPFKDNDRPE